MDGLMDRWMNAWIDDGWVDGRTDGWVHGCMEIRASRWAVGCVSGCMDGSWQVKEGRK